MDIADLETSLAAFSRPFLIREDGVADLSGLSDGELIEVMGEARRLASRAQALELAAVARLVECREAEEQTCRVEVISPREYVHDEVAEALTLTAASADGLIRFATELSARSPGTFAALAAGAIDYAKARTIWHGTAQVNAAVAAAIEERVLPKAAGQTTGQIRAKIRRLVKDLDPDALARRQARAHSCRDVQLVETDDATAHLYGMDLPADAATAAYNRLNAIATGLRTDGDARCIGQLRADIFLALLTGTTPIIAQPPAITVTISGTASGTGSAPGGAPHSAAGTPHPAAGGVTGNDVGWTDTDDAIADLLARSARDRLTGLTAGPHLGGVPGRHHDLILLIAQAGERIAASLADLKTGWCVPDHEQHGYRVPAGMRRLIEERDRRCCFPGCRRPARNCDADHTISFDSGGPTCPCNIALLCRYHHRLKQTPQWRVQQLWPGVFLWITPTGRWRITAPPDRE